MDTNVAMERRNHGSENTCSPHVSAQAFTFANLASATNNFSPELTLNEGGYRRIFKGKLHNSGKLVAVKQIDANDTQRNREFLTELVFSRLHHQNPISLVGHCVEGSNLLLVYEFMLSGL